MKEKYIDKKSRQDTHYYPSKSELYDLKEDTGKFKKELIMSNSISNLINVKKFLNKDFKYTVENVNLISPIEVFHDDRKYNLIKCYVKMDTDLIENIDKNFRNVLYFVLRNVNGLDEKSSINFYDRSHYGYDFSVNIRVPEEIMNSEQVKKIAAERIKQSVEQVKELLDEAIKIKTKAVAADKQKQKFSRQTGNINM